MASNAENVSIWWRHHVILLILTWKGKKTIKRKRTVMVYKNTEESIRFIATYMNSLFGNPNDLYNSLKNVLMEAKAKHFQPRKVNWNEYKHKNFASVNTWHYSFDEIQKFTAIMFHQLCGYLHKRNELFLCQPVWQLVSQPICFLSISLS